MRSLEVKGKIFYFEANGALAEVFRDSNGFHSVGKVYLSTQANQMPIWMMQLQNSRPQQIYSGCLIKAVQKLAETAIEAENNHRFLRKLISLAQSTHLG